MVDLVDKGEAELQQLTQKVTMTTSSASMKASLWVGKGVVAAPFKAVTAIYRQLERRANKRSESGQVSLKDFSKIAEGKRDLVNIDDRAVSKELERELRRHGVVWSVETHRDGSRTFHVPGTDAELIQHALTVAAERVDEKLARNAPELQQGAPDYSSFLDRYQGHYPSFGDYLSDYIEELRRDWPEEAVRYFDYDQYERDASFDYTVLDASDGGVYVFSS